MDLDPALAASMATFLIASASWLTGLVNQRAIKIKALEDQFFHKAAVVRHNETKEDIHEIHMLVNANWSSQMAQYSEAMEEHAKSLDNATLMIEKLMLQNVTSALTAEAIRKEHAATLHAIITMQHASEQPSSHPQKSE
jgi:hypothetical protein